MTQMSYLAAEWCDFTFCKCDSMLDSRVFHHGVRIVGFEPSTAHVGAVAGLAVGLNCTCKPSCNALTPYSLRIGVIIIAR